MNKAILTIILLTLSNILFSQIPPGYYDPASGLTGEALQSALHDIIDDHQVETYGDLWEDFELTDQKANGKVWDMYSDIPGGTPPYQYNFFTDQCGNYTQEGDCYNREHSFPKSWYGGQVYPMYSDLYVIYPTDGWVNNKRGNFPYGEVGNTNWTSLNGSKLGNCSFPGYSGIVFEPIDDYKGDFARSYFYMATRYYNEDAGWPGSDMTNGAQPKPWALELLYDWHMEDPVSTKETDRNDAVYDIQNNRNPFIDHPEFVEQIWFTTGLHETGISHGDFSVFPNPFNETFILRLSSKLSGERIKIKLTDLSGRLLNVKQELNPGNISFTVKELNEGIYFLRITDIQSGHKVVFKLIK